MHVTSDMNQVEFNSDPFARLGKEILWLTTLAMYTLGPYRQDQRTEPTYNSGH